MVPIHMLRVEKLRAMQYIRSRVTGSHTLCQDQSCRKSCCTSGVSHRESCGFSGVESQGVIQYVRREIAGSHTVMYVRS